MVKRPRLIILIFLLCLCSVFISKTVGVRAVTAFQGREVAVSVEPTHTSNEQAHLFSTQRLGPVARSYVKSAEAVVQRASLYANAAEMGIIAPPYPQAPESWFMDLDLLRQGAQNQNLKPSKMGKFRTRCMYSHMGADDPIVLPGQPNASHLHVFFGNTDTDAFTTVDALKSTGGKSTCSGGTLNKSAYWVPAVLDQDNRPVNPFHIFVYYKQWGGGPASESIENLPEGLTILSNAPTVTQEEINHQDRKGWPYHPDFACTGIGWNTAQKATRTLPSCQKGKVLQMRIPFPACWDGENLTSPDNLSHMAFVTGPKQQCPTTHPHHLPKITVHAFFPVNIDAGTAGWHLSSDMGVYDWQTQGAGLTLHADWMDGWDAETKEQWFQACFKPEGGKAPIDCGVDNIGDGLALGWDQDGRDDIFSGAINEIMFRSGRDRFTALDQLLHPAES